MVDSGYVYDRGEAIVVGSHGDTSYLYHSGEPVLNRGRSLLVHETGIGLGGGGSLTWNKFLDGHPNASVQFNTGQEEVYYEHDGGEGGTWIGAYSNENADSPPWEIEFANVNGTQNDINNNVGFGVVSGTPPDPRPFLDPQNHSYIGYHFDEAYQETGEAPSGHALVTSDGSATDQNGDNVVEIDPVDFSDTDFVVGFDGTEAYLKQDGLEIARTSQQVADRNYMVVCSIEDDGESTASENVSVGAVLTSGL